MLARMESSVHQIGNEIHVLSDPPIDAEFESIYMKLCSREHRLYSDAEVKELPNAFSYNRHIKEWKAREQMLKRFLKYLKKRNRQQLQILDIGCGNAWFAAQLAANPNFKVDAVDISMPILQQAARVFKMSNLQFYYADIFDEVLEASSYDIIILNNTIQFFPNLTTLINRCEHFYKEDGEIHILDSPLFSAKQIPSISQKDAYYLRDLKCEEFSKYKHYHTKVDLELFRHEYLYKPGLLNATFGSSGLDHPWIRIKAW